MAKLERTFYHNDFDRLLEKIEERIINGSVSASMEDQSDFEAGGSRCSVRVFERYSWSGGNRLSMSVTLFQAGEEIHLSAITGGLLEIEYDRGRVVPGEAGGDPGG